MFSFSELQVQRWEDPEATAQIFVLSFVWLSKLGIWRKASMFPYCLVLCGKRKSKNARREEITRTHHRQTCHLLASPNCPCQRDEPTECCSTSGSHTSASLLTILRDIFPCPFQWTVLFLYQTWLLCRYAISAFHCFYYDDTALFVTYRGRETEKVWPGNEFLLEASL